MSSASSHTESRSVKISTHRSRVLSCPSGDSVSVAVVPSSNALGDSETADALAAILSTDAIEAGLRFSLHPVIEGYLEQWRISPSQMAPNSWRYLVAFLWECYVSGIRVTRELFMACFRLSREQAGYYLAIHSGFCVRCTFQQQRLEIIFFLHFLSPRLELPDRVDLSDSEQLRTGIIDRRD
ncbi:hypothetical protein BHM03_00023969 [Ensete ventricosum]|nr:hypothetical protein BHM03_00023969 [Ensete ventricosum]